MKKLLSVMLAVLAMLTISASVYAEDASEIDTGIEKEFDASKFCDADNNGKVSAADARYILRVSARLEDRTDHALEYCDTNKDGKISASDARTILRVAAKLENVDCLINGHKYKFEKTVKAACHTEGYDLYKCTDCSATKKENVKAKTSHTFKKGSVVKGTCVSEGYTEYKCAVCGAVEKRDITKSGGHKYEKISEERVPFADYIGDKEQKKCKYCNDIIITYATHGEDYQIPTTILESSAAIAIQDKFGAYSYHVEGYDITGKNLVIYGHMHGMDITGRFYRLDGTLWGNCERCGRVAGEGENMCSLMFCGLTMGSL